MDKNDLKRSLHHCFGLFFKKMERRYANYQLKITSEDANAKAIAIMRYVAEFADADIQPEQLNKYADEILDLRQYAARPPTPREFVFEIKDRVFEVQDSLHSELSTLFERFRAKYRQLWATQDQKSLVLSEISEALDGHPVTSDQIHAAEKRITADPGYRTYPPTPDKVAESILICARDPDVPAVSNSYFLAAKAREKTHPLIRKARTDFGAYAIRTRTDSRVKGDFEQLYAMLLTDYAFGRLSLPAEPNREVVVSVFEETDQLTASELNKILRG